MATKSKKKSKSKSSKTSPSLKQQQAVLGNKLGFAASEAYKRLRANILYALPINEKSKCRVIGITSAERGEGKSTTSVNLAYTIAESGKRVLYLEGDMRLPNVAKRLNLATEPGLSELLAGISVGSEVFRKSGLHDNLYIIPAGKIPPNPSELLGSETMKNVIGVLKDKFDFIIFDLPPVNAVSDGIVISKLVDGMIFVVRENYAHKKEVEEGIRQLQFANAKILGFVLSDSTFQEKRYGRYGKYGTYEYYK